MEVKAFSLAILGDENVGKTSFANRYISNEFNEVYHPTRGAEYFQQIFFHKNHLLKLNIYCSSGDKKSERITKYLYKDAHSIIIMFNVNKKTSFNNLNYYLDTIRMNSVEDPLIYIVGNGIDEDQVHRQVSPEKLKEFEKRYNLKCFEVSCKTGKGVKELMEELTKEVLVTEKWNSSSIDKDISDNTFQDNNEKELEKMSKAMKSHYKETKDKKNNYIRCKGCDQLLFIKFKNIYNEVAFICDHCNVEKDININKVDEFIESLDNKIVCYQCKKIKEEKIKLEYGSKYKRYVCPGCKKSILKQQKALQGENNEYIPYYLMDITCFEHYRKILGYCKNCKTCLCVKCFESHKTHENIFFNDFLDKLINEHKIEFKKELDFMNVFKKNCEDCINAIKAEFNKFITIKEKELKLKEQLLTQLENIKFNYHLIETIKNMKYMKSTKYEAKSSWDQKLTDIFEAIGQPIQIKNINITKNSNSYVTPSIVKLKTNINDEEEGEIKHNGYNTYADNIKEITDICLMDDKKYLGVSLSTGKFLLYDDILKNNKPIYTYEIFKEFDGIKSVYKSIRNMNNFFFCGREKIKNIEFYNEYSTMKTIMEITDKKSTFTLALEQNNSIITCDINNKIIIYDKESNKVGDITESIDRYGNKDIYSMNEFMNNIIIITYNKISDNSSGSSQSRSSNYFFNDSEETNVDMSASRTSIKEQPQLGTKILELDEHTHRSKKEHILSEKQSFIGILNQRYMLIRDDNYNSVILFDAKTFKNVQRFYFDEGEKPIFGSMLERRPNLIDFVLVSENMNIMQNIYDEEHKNVKQILGVKIKIENENINADVVKTGKIIHNTFKGFIKYIGDNEFVVINY